MPHQVSETIPSALSERVDAAVAFFNESDLAAGDTFSATGIIDADNALDQSGDLKLILCGGDRCEQHSFRVSGTGSPWSIEIVNGPPAQKASHRLSSTHLRAPASPGLTL